MAWNRLERALGFSSLIQLLLLLYFYYEESTIMFIFFIAHAAISLPACLCRAKPALAAYCIGCIGFIIWLTILVYQEEKNKNWLKLVLNFTIAFFEFIVLLLAAYALYQYRYPPRSSRSDTYVAVEEAEIVVQDPSIKHVEPVNSTTTTTTGSSYGTAASTSSHGTSTSAYGTTEVSSYQPSVAQPIAAPIPSRPARSAYVDIDEDDGFPRTRPPTSAYDHSPTERSHLRR